MAETLEPLPQPEESPKLKRLSFREANLGPDPKPEEPPPRPHGLFATRKRTIVISLLGLGAASAAIYGVTQLNSDCGQNSAAQWTSGQATPCTHSSGGGWHSGFGFSSGGSTADAASASRGGFGSTGSAHGGGGE